MGYAAEIVRVPEPEKIILGAKPEPEPAFRGFVNDWC
jgi:hypothetical protein